MVANWKQFHADNLAKIPQDKRELVVQFLKGYFADDVSTIRDIRAAAVKDPETWWVEYHHTWGMAVRDLLRRNGYGEKYLGVKNLANVYVGLIEESLL